MFTSQAGLRRAAPSSYTALWQKAGDQPSYREPGPFGGCNFLSHKCFCSKETLEEGLYMHPNRLLDLKIVFNQHPKPPNGITNVFRFGAHPGVVNFLFLFR